MNRKHVVVPTDFNVMEKVVSLDVPVLKEKGKHYGQSWQQRGGVGAFMMLARKWDRLEQMCKTYGYDIFALLRSDIGEGLVGQELPEEGVLDTLRDLRRYLLLVETYIVQTEKCYAEELYTKIDKHVQIVDGIARRKTDTVFVLFTADNEGTALNFIEVENEQGKSVRVGEWLEHNGYHALKLDIVRYDEPEEVVERGGSPREEEQYGH